MKNIFSSIFSFLFLFFIIGCSCKKTVDQLSLLPAATTTGANTFGCLVNGQAMLPTNGIVSLSNPNPYRGIETVFWDSAICTIDIHNANGSTPQPGEFKFHLGTFNKFQTGTVFAWEQSSFDDPSSPYYSYHNHVTGIFYVDSLKSYAWFGSYNNSGTTTITKFDTLNKIISGTFNGNLRIKNGTMVIPVTNGRFDIKWGH